jgi:hypothetical protein
MKIQTLVYVEPEEEFLDSESEIDSTVMHSEGASQSVMKKQPNQVHVNAFIPPVHKFNDASTGLSELFLPLNILTLITKYLIKGSLVVDNWYQMFLLVP